MAVHGTLDFGYDYLQNLISDYINDGIHCQRACCKNSNLKAKLLCHIVTNKESNQPQKVIQGLIDLLLPNEQKEEEKAYNQNELSKKNNNELEDWLEPEILKKSGSKMTLIKDKRLEKSQEDLKTLLSPFNQKTLAMQCSNMACCANAKLNTEVDDEANGSAVLLEQCIPLRRIHIVLYLYFCLIEGNYPASSMFHLLEQTGYSHQQLFDDFCHVKIVHIDAGNKAFQRSDVHHNIGMYLCRFFQKVYPCDIDKCQVFTRHHRDRRKGTPNAYDDKNEEEATYQQECDKIHSYFIHSTVRYGTNEGQCNINETLLMGISRSHSLRKFPSNLNTLSHDSFADESLNEEKEISYPTQGLMSSLRSDTTQDDVEPPQKHIDKMVRHSGRLRSETPKSTSVVDAKSGYIGKQEDDKWWEKVDTKPTKGTKEEKEAIYAILIKNIGIFRWQNAHGFKPGTNRESIHCKPRWSHIKEEALNNKFQPISADDWNHTLRKSKIFTQSWVSQKIRTMDDGYFNDQITEQRQKWKKQEVLSLPELITLKLYTDFDKLQFELKKCFRYQTVADVLKCDEKNEENENEKEKEQDAKAAVSDLHERLQHFYHWRGSLLIVLHKFGTKWSKMNSMPLYHGVNTQMLIRASQTYAFNGPLSTSASYHVAMTFATAKGMVLKVTSHFPRLNYCNAFDASSISDYPEEQEWLVGFMYLRLLEVRTRKLSENEEEFEELMAIVPLSTWVRKEFFAIHLFREQIYSMSDHLERIISQFLRANRFECCGSDKDRLEKYQNQSTMYKDWKKKEGMVGWLCPCIHSEAVNPEQSDKKVVCKKPENVTKEDWQRKFNIFPVLADKFNEFRLEPSKRQRVKFDKISPYLRRFFMQQSTEKDILTGELLWDISFEEITTVYPKAEELHFVNNFTLNDAVLKGLIDHIQNGNRLLQKEGEEEELCKCTIEKVVFLYYNYTDADVDNDGKPIKLKKFIDPETLDKGLKEKLKECKWEIKANKIQKSGYKIRIINKNKNKKKK